MHQPAAASEGDGGAAAGGVEKDIDPLDAFMAAEVEGCGAGW